MKKSILRLAVIGLAGSLALHASIARANFEVSVGVNIHAAADFYAPLSAEGAWIEVGSYGRCWRPASIAVDWRPYCVGHWVWTDCGWYWDSDEPWGWACYHYGYWVYDPAYSWVWIPGVEWAPAWVSWRVGGGYIGWGPLAPPGVAFARVAPASEFVFVQEGRFTDPLRPSTVIVNNVTIINKTTRINNIRRETRTLGGSGSRSVFVNEGPGLRAVQKATARSIKPTPIQEAVRHERIPEGIIRRGRAPEPNRGSTFAPAGRGESVPRTPEPPRERVAPSQEPPRSEPFRPAPEPRAAPGENRDQPARPAPPNWEKPRPGEGAPRPPARPAPSEGPHKQEHGPSEDRGHERDHENGGHG